MKSTLPAIALCSLSAKTLKKHIALQTPTNTPSNTPGGKLFLSFLSLTSLFTLALVIIPLWWSTALIAFAWAWRPLPYGKKSRMLLYFFAAGWVSWLAVALFFHLCNAGLLTSRMADLLHLPPILLLFITGLIGGLTAIAGASLKQSIAR